MGFGQQDEGVKYRISLEDYFSQGIQKAESSALGFESTISNLQSKIAALFTGYQAFNFAKSVITVGGNFEAAEIGLATLLKSSEKAKSVMDNVKQDALTTPFGVQGLLMGNRALISAGVSARQAREDVLNLANAISATGGGDDELQRMVVNMQQIKNVGKATAMDVKQFAIAGINIYGLLAEASGKTTEQVKDMDVSYELLTEALKKAREEGGLYEAGLEKMANSTNVMVSNLGDMWDSFKNDVFVNNKANIDSTIMSIQGLITTLKQHYHLVTATIKGAIAIFLAYKATLISVTAYQTIYATVTGWKLVSALTGATVAQTALNAVMALNPYVLAATAIAAVAAGLYSVSAAAEDARENMRLFKESQMSYHETSELDLIELEIDKLMRADKKLTESMAREKVLRAENERYSFSEFVDPSGATTQIARDSKGIYQTFEAIRGRGKAAAEALADFNRQKLRTGGLTTSSDALGSGLSEPKASKIQNITINLSNPFNNFKVYAQSLGMAQEEIGQKFTEFLVSLTTDAAIVAQQE